MKSTLQDAVNRSKLSKACIARELGVSRQFLYQMIKENAPIPNRLRAPLEKLLNSKLV